MQVQQALITINMKKTVSKLLKTNNQKKLFVVRKKQTQHVQRNKVKGNSRCLFGSNANKKDWGTKKKTVNLEFYNQKKHLKNEGETKSISDIQKLKESITHRHA